MALFGIVGGAICFIGAWFERRDKMRVGAFSLVGVILMLVGMAGLAADRPARSPPGSSVSAAASPVERKPALPPARAASGYSTAPEPDPAKVAARREFIRKDLIVKLRVFTKVEDDGTGPAAWTGRGWYRATLDEKQQFASVVYAYFFEGPHQNDHSNVLTIVNGMTGKRTGRYGPFFGGLEMD